MSCSAKTRGKSSKKMAKSRVVTVSAAQFTCTDDVSTNADTAERLVRAAHQKGANIILIQELFEGCYFCEAQREDFFLNSKPYKGHPTILRMQNLAKELGVVIPVSFFEKANDAHYNSIVLIDADGTDIGLYPKLHITDGPGYQVKYYFNPIDPGFKVFQTKFAKIGVGLCWDERFPEAARAMVLQGAEILFYPMAVGSEPQDQGLDAQDHWKWVMQGLARANVVPLVASIHVWEEIIQTEHGESEITFYGNSFIAGPSGEIVENADDEEEAILIAQFDLDKLKSKRYSWGLFFDQLPDLHKVNKVGFKRGRRDDILTREAILLAKLAQLSEGYDNDEAKLKRLEAKIIEQKAKMVALLEKAENLKTSMVLAHVEAQIIEDALADQEDEFQVWVESLQAAERTQQECCARWEELRRLARIEWG